MVHTTQKVRGHCDKDQEYLTATDAAQVAQSILFEPMSFRDVILIHTSNGSGLCETVGNSEYV